MTKSRHDFHEAPSRSHRSAGSRRGALAIASLLVALGACALVFMLPIPRAPAPAPRAGSPDPTPPPATRPTPPPAANPASTKATPASQAVDPQKLVGRWQRLDGDYQLEVQRVGADRKVEAAYFNPRSIHVARAEADQPDQDLRLLVELRDSGYPGCTYKLRYDPTADQLKGEYFQAALNETFEVVFARVAAGKGE